MYVTFILALTETKYSIMINEHKHSINQEEEEEEDTA